MGKAGRAALKYGAYCAGASGGFTSRKRMGTFHRQSDRASGSKGNSDGFRALGIKCRSKEGPYPAGTGRTWPEAPDHHGSASESVVRVPGIFWRQLLLALQLLPGGQRYQSGGLAPLNDPKSLQRLIICCFFVNICGCKKTENERETCR